MTLLWLALLGCRPDPDPSCEADPRICFDRDEDGYALRDDCNDTDGAVNPGVDEVPLNAVDDDCDPDSQDGLLDRDGDSYVEKDDCDDRDYNVHPDRSEQVYDTIDNDCDPTTPDDDLDGDGSLFVDDCDDLDERRSPAFDEVPYDLVDNDCDAATRDDDIDGDGYPVALDCDDQNGLRFPGNTEVPYDSVDNDCDGGTPDNDIDGDGTPHPLDCDDTDAGVGPGVLEVAGNGADDDCDTLVDVVPLEFSDLLWDKPSKPEVLYDLDWFVINTTVAGLKDGPSAVGDGAVALFFGEDTSGSLTKKPSLWYEATLFAAQPAHAAVAAPGKGFASAFGIGNGTSDALRLGLSRAELNSGETAFEATQLTVSGTEQVAFSDVDVQRTLSGEVWSIGCHPGGIFVARASGDPDDWALGDSVTTSDWTAEQCALSVVDGGGVNADVVTAHLCTAGACETVAVDLDAPMVLAEAQPLAEIAVRRLDAHGPRLVVVHDDESRISVFEGGESWVLPLVDDVVEADVAVRDGIAWVILLIDDGTGALSAKLTTGNPTFPLGWAEFPLFFEDPPRVLEAEHVGIEVSDDRVIWAISGTNSTASATDAVGWGVMGLP